LLFVGFSSRSAVGLRAVRGRDSSQSPPPQRPPHPRSPHPHPSNFKIINVSDGERPGEKFAQLQYTLMDKRVPNVDESGKKVGWVGGNRWQLWQLVLMAAVTACYQWPQSRLPAKNAPPARTRTFKPLNNPHTHARTQIRRVLIENGRFLQDDKGQWQMADYRLVDVPGALVKSAELESKNLRAQAEAKKAAASAGGGEA
jgi:hypothetical protein